jgi:ferredoxin-NADP reductase
VQHPKRGEVSAVNGPKHELVVASIWDETPHIKAIQLVAPEGAALPGWQAGSHVEVEIPSGGTRCYSLIARNAAEMAAGSSDGNTSYLLGVMRDAKAGDGPQHMHRLQLGDRVVVSSPINLFPITATSSPIVLCAGGIGITPILSMAASLAVQGKKPLLIYAGRARAEMAFLREVEALDLALTVHADDEAGSILDIQRVVRNLAANETLYLCGPQGMIDAALSAERNLGFVSNRVRYERFQVPTPTDQDTAFDIVLASSGETLHVARDETILDVLIRAGKDPLYDCKRGDCGLCLVGLLDGVPDHRDTVLSEDEKRQGNVIQVCVSRALSPSITLDI